MYRVVLMREPTSEEPRFLPALHDEATCDQTNDLSGPRKLSSYDRVLYKQNRKATLVHYSRRDAPKWPCTTQDPGELWVSTRFDDSLWNAGR